MKSAPARTLEGVFRRLLVDIVSGTYPPGARLPAERDLAQRLGASRPTLREALRRLGEWRLVEARRGSGVLVRDPRTWSLAVLPVYLKLGAPGKGPAALAQLIVDLLALRRSLFVDLLRFVASRLQPGALQKARETVRRAWEVRHDYARFVREDYQILHSLADGAGFLPALWLLNDLADVYYEMAGTIAGAAPVPEEYLDTYASVFADIERGALDTACRRLTAYFEHHDRRLLAALGIQQ